MSTFLLWPDTYLYCNSTYHLMPNKKAPIFVKGVAKQARKPRSYASSKLRACHLLTGVKCRATSVAKNWRNSFFPQMFSSSLEL